MSKLEKAKERIKSASKDYTYTEAKNLLKALGYTEWNKGKTSGSRVRFYRETDGVVINLHKPHPRDEMKEYAVKQLLTTLLEHGDL